MKAKNIVKIAGSTLLLPRRADVVALLISSLLVSIIAPFLVTPSRAQALDQAAQRKKWLTESNELIEKLNSQRAEKIAEYHIEGFDDYITREIPVGGELSADTGPYYTLADKFDTYFKSPATSPPPADDPIKDLDFYRHPLNYFKHHINWVANKDYDKKINWGALVGDFEIWKSNEKQVWELYDQIKKLDPEIQELRNKSTDDPAERQRIQAKIDELEKKQEEYRNKMRELLKFRGRYGFVLETDEGGIARTIVLTSQTAMDKGVPRFPYPFWKGVEVDTSGNVIGKGTPSDQFETGGAQPATERLLFVIGKGVPTDYSSIINVTSDDPSITYTVLALEKVSTDKNPDRIKAFEDGRRIIGRQLDPKTKSLLDECDAMLIRATLKQGVLPGYKDFKVNEFESSWELRFGDDVAQLSFARGIGNEAENPEQANLNRVELTETLFLPEQGWIEARTMTTLPLDELRFRVQAGGKDVGWNPLSTTMIDPVSQLPGFPFLGAKLVRYEPIGPIVETRPRPEAPARLMRKMAAVYRTPLIEFYKNGEAVPPREPGVYRLPVEFRDAIVARLENPTLFRSRPAFAIAFNDPSEVGLTWRHALTKAAKIAGYDVADWNRIDSDKLGGKKAAEIANTTVTNLIIPNQRPVSLVERYVRWRYPLYYAAYKFYKGDLTEKTYVKLSDHAALLLFKDAFLVQLDPTLKYLEKINERSKWEAAAWLDSLKPVVPGDPDAASPWEFVKVKAPKAADVVVPNAAPEVPFSMALNDAQLEKTFGKSEQGRAKARAWAIEAAKEALGKYKEAVQLTVNKLRNTPDTDIAGLLEFIGVGYEAVIPQVMPRMMHLRKVGAGGYERWQADSNTRLSLMRLHITADAVRAQKEFASLDKRFLLAMAFAIAAPFIVAFAAPGTWAAFFLSEVVAGIGPSILEAAVFDVPELWNQREDIKFALGASSILGSDRLRLAQINKTEWYQVGLNIVAGYFGGKVLSVGVTSSVTRAVTWARAGLVYTKVRRGGLAAFEKLPMEDRTALLDFITEAHAVKKLDPLAMTTLHRKAIGIGERIVADIRAKAGSAAVTTTGTTGTGGATGPTGGGPTTPTGGPTGPPGPTGPTSPPKAIEAKGEAGKPPPRPTRKPKTGTSVGSDDHLVITFEELGIGAGDSVAPKPPAPDFIQPEPEAGKPWVTQTGGEKKVVIVELGASVGEGTGVSVFDLKSARIAGNPIPGCEKGCVAKIGRPEKFGVVPSKRDAALGTAEGAKILTESGIPQIEIIYDGSEAGRAFFIQRKVEKAKGFILDSNQTADGSRQWAPETLAEAKRFGLTEADISKHVTELAYKMFEKGIAMEDFHGRNICIEIDNGKPIAKIFDQDRIVYYYNRGQARAGWWFDLYESNIAFDHVTSLYAARPNKFATLRKARDYFQQNPGPYWPSLEFFWHKQFEYKGWIKFKPLVEMTPGEEQIIGGTWESGLLDINIVKQRFPQIDDPMNLQPFDTSQPFWQQRGFSVPPNEQGRMLLPPLPEIFAPLFSNLFGDSHAFAYQQ